MTRTIKTPQLIVTLTPLAVRADSRTYKQASSIARLGYQSIVVEGVQSGFDAGSQLPFELVSCAPPPPATDSVDTASGGTGSIAVPKPIPNVTKDYVLKRYLRNNRSRVRKAIERLPGGNWIIATFLRTERLVERIAQMPPRSHPKFAGRLIISLLKGIIILPLKGTSAVQFASHFSIYLYKYFWCPLRTTPKASLYYLHAFYQFPAVYILCLLYRAKFIYDAHDFYSQLEMDENLSRYWRHWVLPLERAIERVCVRKAAAVVTVNEGIAQLMKERFGCSPIILRNAHDGRLDRPVGSTIRDQIGLSDSDFLVVSIGNWKPGMAIEEAFAAFETLPDNFHLAFLGSGYPCYQKTLVKLGLVGRVHILRAVPPQEVVPYIASANASIILYYSKSLNYLNALPNRFFQGIAADLPLLYPPLPEIKRLADHYGIGMLIDPRDPATIAQGIRSLDGGASLLPQLQRARDALAWENEEVKLASLISWLVGQESFAIGGIDRSIRDADISTMRRKKALYLDANGTGPVVIAADTLLRGLLGLQDGARPPAWLRSQPKVVNLYAHLRQFYDRLSYVADWRDAFCASPQLDTEVCNINNLLHFGKCLLRIRRYDLIIISHVAAGDDMSLMLRAASFLARRECPLVVFFGNEYDLLDQKIEFARRVRAEQICSQLPLAAAQYLYSGLDGTQVVSMPHALNQSVYRPPVSQQRDVDVGFAGDIYWPFVGDQERTLLIRHFEAKSKAYGLVGDIRTDSSSRMARHEWAAFLQRCNGIIGAESGTYYLNEKGGLLNRARHYNLHENQGASFEEVYDRFYKDVPRSVSGKSISSRHFEPIGTKTCQILLEGEYNGILKAGEHYIAVKRDLCNLDEAVREFKDEGRRIEITERAYDYVMSSHTYERRVAGMLSVIF